MDSTKLIELGFDVMQTGGGCTALHLNVPGGRHVLVTNDDSGRTFDGELIGVEMYADLGDVPVAQMGQSFANRLDVFENAEGFTVLGFVSETETMIDEPFMSECGRFAVDPIVEYGISGDDAAILLAINEALRNLNGYFAIAKQGRGPIVAATVQPVAAPVIAGSVGKAIAQVAPEIAAVLAPEVLACEADSVVGAACVDLVRKVAAVLAVEASDGGCIEDDVREALIDAAVRQCDVWYFG